MQASVRLWCYFPLLSPCCPWSSRCLRLARSQQPTAGSGQRSASGAAAARQQPTRQQPTATANSQQPAARSRRPAANTPFLAPGCSTPARPFSPLPSLASQRLLSPPLLGRGPTFLQRRLRLPRRSAACVVAGAPPAAASAPSGPGRAGVVLHPELQNRVRLLPEAQPQTYLVMKALLVLNKHSAVAHEVGGHRTPP